MYFEEEKAAISSELFTGLGALSQEFSVRNGEKNWKYIQKNLKFALIYVYPIEPFPRLVKRKELCYIYIGYFKYTLRGKEVDTI